MATFLFVLLVAVSVAMVAWGLSRRERILQYPTLAGATWLLYMAPQALGILRNPQSVPAMALEDGGLEMALGMCVLCALAGWLGYMHPWRSKPAGPAKAGQYSRNRILHAGLALLGVGMLAFYKLASLSGGWVAFFSTEGSYALEWRGLPVAYVFFAGALFPALFLLLVSALAGRNTVGWIGAVAGALPLLASAVFLGRRTQTVFMIMIVLLAVLFVRGWAPPRPAAIVVMLVTAVAVVAAGEYRKYSPIGGDWGEVRHLDPQVMVQSIVSGEGYSEFQFALVQISATNRFKEFGLGRGFYNTLVANWIPRLLVGDAVKESFFIEGPDYGQQTYAAYQWSPGYGSNPTGINNAFCEFWFFGALLYFGLGKGFRYLWDRAFITRDFAAMLFYACLSPLAMTTILGNLSGVPSDLLYVSLFVVPAIVFARLPKSATARSQSAPLKRIGARGNNDGLPAGRITS
ncbi:MAG TPA: hypothetical protein VMT45_05880 [Thermoanaerobaculaceae bacterium]|nr:hypothetical protein [Thermoanaerobaculaceae bacterium]